ncbi:hypothetical protein ACFL6S_13205 [Candidatus Poribacteria bacterium]
MASHFIRIISYSDLHGQRVDMSVVRNVLKDFRLSAIVEMISRLTFLLFREEYNQQIQRCLSHQLLDVDNHKKAMKALSKPDCIIFSRMQLLKLLQLAFNICKEDGHKTFAEEEYRFEFGRIILIANDEPEPQGNRIIDLLTSLINIAEISSVPKETGIAYPMARWHILLLEMDKNTYRPCRNINTDELVKAIFGMSLQEYYALIFSIVTYLDILEIDVFMSNPSSLFIDTEHFLNVPSMPDLSKQYSQLKSDIIDLPKMADEIQKANNCYSKNSFMILRQYPLVRYRKDLVLCIDPGFLMNKLSSGLYWAIHKFLRERDKESLKNFMDCRGRLFEKYVDDLFRRTYPEFTSVIIPTHYLSPPDFRDSDYGDGIIYSEDGINIAIIEYKSSLLTAEAKYGGSVDVLESDIRKKFVERGVDQLVQKIANFLCRNLRNKRPVPGVTYSNIRNIFPVLITLEPAMDTFFMNNYLNLKFQSKIKAYQINLGINVHPLVVLTVDDLERLEPYLLRRGLWECLHKYLLSDDYKFGSFRTYINNNIYKDGFLQNPFLKEKFNEVGVDIMSILSNPSQEP